MMWLRRTAGILTLGGGAAGVMIVLMALAEQVNSPVDVAICALFTALFIAGIVIGVWILERDPRGARWAIPYFALQIPTVASGALSYHFATGALFFVALGAAPGVHFDAQVGTVFRLMFAADVPFSLGVNVVAIAMVVLLRKHRDRL